VIEVLFKSHREKKKCSECASAVDWLSWFIETISNRKDLTIAEKKKDKDVIKGSNLLVDDNKGEELNRNALK
jgi:hypothetical protein